MYHFIGIKGTGMSALAQVTKGLGYEVEGSDVTNHFYTQVGLEKLNIKLMPYDKNNIHEGLIIIKGASIKDNHEELVRARELGLKIYEYEEWLGHITRMFKTISISGTHGKTTTTAMASHVFSSIKDVNYQIGDGTGYASLNNDTFILESCEYKRHFLHYSPAYVIITNIDYDHVDCFKDIDEMIHTYEEFSELASVMVIACGDDENVRKLKTSKTIKYYGFNDNNDIIATNVIYSDEGTSFDVIIDNNNYGHYDLPIFGEHMVLDALAVIATSYYEGLNADDVSKSLSTFKGAKKRFMQTFTKDSVVIDDYAHHPSEIKAILNSVKQKFKDKRMVVIFEPLTYSRTQIFYKDIAKVLSVADKVYVMDIHGAREFQEDFKDVTPKLLTDLIENSEYLNIKDYQKLIKEKPAAFIFMSGNDMSEIKEPLIAELNK